MKTKTRKPKTPKLGRVSHLAISRLFNLGNYCNRKIEISAEVASGQSASETLQTLYQIVERLGPLRPPDCKGQYEAALRQAPSEQSEYVKEHLDEWNKEMANHALKQEQRGEALRALDDLGGFSKTTDHKESWDSDDTPF